MHILFRIFLVSAVSILVSTSLQAQNIEINTTKINGGPSKVILYGDILIGPAFNALINLEAKLGSSASNKTHLYLRGGYGGGGVLLGFGGPGVAGALTILKKRGKNYLDLSGGVMTVRDNYVSDRYILPILDIGYRWQKPEGGFLFKAKLGFAGVGFGLGYAF